MGLKENDVVELSNYEVESYQGEPLILNTHHIILSHSEQIIPCYIGLFVYQKLNAAQIEHLKRHEPIGCRDYYTLNQCLDNGIDAFLFGCTTTVLPKRKRNQKVNQVFLIDLPEGAEEYIPDSLRKDARYLTQIAEYKSEEDFERIADEYYDTLFHEARLVITSRLHCAFFCILHGIPVVMMREHYVTRLSAIDEFIPVYDRKKWKEVDFDPPEITIPDDFNEDKINCAANMLRAAYHQAQVLHDREKLKSLPEVKHEYKNEDYSSFIQNIGGEIDRLFPDKASKYKFSIWGVSPTNMDIYEYISTNHQNATLVNVYDAYREVEFAGHISKPVAMLKTKPAEEICITAAGCAINERIQMANDLRLPRENLFIINTNEKH
jgi:hypothetical protein